MPEEKVYAPLTEKEKQEIIAKHKALVDKMNASLPDGMKVAVDENLEARLDDPKEVAVYRIGLEMKEKLRRQDKIFNDLESRFGKYTGEQNAFNRNLKFGFKTENTPEAIRYNEKLYDLYLHDQEKLAYFRYKDVLNFNPQKVYECGEDKQKLAEFYRDNQQLCEDGFVIKSSLDYIKTPKPLKDALICMKKPFEGLVDPANIVKGATGEEYFTLPKVTAEQCALLQSNNAFMDDASETLKQNFTNIYNNIDNPKTCNQFLDQFVKKGYKFEPGFFVKYQAVNINPKNKVRTQVSFDEIFEENNPNVRIVERDKNAQRQIKFVSSAFQNAYMNKWKERFNINSNKPQNGSNLDVNNVEDSLKGGFFERTFHTTSPQFRYLMKTFKEYNDPNSEGYMNEERLNFAAEAYKKEKIAKGYREETANATEKKRMGFVDSIIQTVKQSKDNEKADREKIERDFDNSEGVMKSNIPSQQNVVEPAEVALEGDIPENVPAHELRNNNIEANNENEREEEPPVA